jgi:hypothetical protein
MNDHLLLILSGSKACCVWRHMGKENAGLTILAPTGTTRVFARLERDQPGGWCVQVLGLQTFWKALLETAVQQRIDGSDSSQDDTLLKIAASLAGQVTPRFMCSLGKVHEGDLHARMQSACLASRMQALMTRS